MIPERPALRRYLEPLPLKAETADGVQDVFALKDPFRLTQGSVVLPPAGVALAALLDGSRTLGEVQEEFRGRYGVRVPLDQVTELVQILNDALLLEGPHLARFIQEFTDATSRAPACVGNYPGEPEELRTFLENQYTRSGGPGAGPQTGSNGRAIRGVVSPHIDMHRGGHSYAWAWRAVAESCEAELFVIFGTSHAGTAPIDRFLESTPPLYALTRKTFETPLGPVVTDAQLVDTLLESYAGADDLLAGEFHHRGEHSIEFQAVYLAHLFGGRRPIRILPILCGSIDGQPTADDRFTDFHQALRTALAPIPPEKVAFVAAIDLAHNGVQFHEPPVGDQDLERIEAQDRETLRLTTELRCPDAVHDDIARDDDPRNICGHAPLVSLLEALRDRPVSGELLHYDRWYDGESTVSFASAIFRDEA